MALIDDLEIAAARQFFELDQGEIRFDAGRIAIHHETDRARRRDHRHLRVAESIGRAQFQRAIPGASGREQHGRRALLRLDRRSAKS